MSREKRTAISYVIFYTNGVPVSPKGSPQFPQVASSNSIEPRDIDVAQNPRGESDACTIVTEQSRIFGSIPPRCDCRLPVGNFEHAMLARFHARKVKQRDENGEKETRRGSRFDRRTYWGKKKKKRKKKNSPAN